MEEAPADSVTTPTQVLAVLEDVGPSKEKGEGEEEGEGAPPAAPPSLENQTSAELNELIYMYVYKYARARVIPTVRT